MNYCCLVYDTLKESLWLLIVRLFFRKANFKIFCLKIQVVLVSLLYCRLQESQCLWSHWPSLSGETNLSVIFSFLVCVGYISWIFIVHHCQTKQKLKLFLLFVCLFLFQLLQIKTLQQIRDRNLPNEHLLNNWTTKVYASRKRRGNSSLKYNMKLFFNA